MAFNLTPHELFQNGRIRGVYNRKDVCRTCKKHDDEAFRVGHSSEKPKHVCTPERNVIQIRFKGWRKSSWVVGGQQPEKLLKQIVDMWKADKNDIDIVTYNGEIVAAAEPHATEAEAIQWLCSVTG